MTILVPVRNAGFAIIDDADAHRITRLRWAYATRGMSLSYVQTSTRPVRLMHQVVLGDPPVGQVIDHINGNTFDNRRSNLRFCSQGDNAKNRVGRDGFKGVRHRPQSDNWQARITVNYREMHLGVFQTADEAARAYDDAARLHYGEFARTNFGPGPTFADLDRLVIAEPA